MTGRVADVADSPDDRNLLVTDAPDGVWHTGPYFSKGPLRESRWSSLLRMAKDPTASDGGWDALRFVCNRGVAEVRRRSRLPRIHAVVAVPSRICRLRHRGVSLPDELGKALHGSLGMRYEADGLISTVDYIEIKRIAVERRREIITGTFTVATRKLKGESVLLIDDIMTSGATVGECAYQLRKTAVFVYTLGRTADPSAGCAGEET